AVRHFATTSWPLSSGHPALLVAAGLLLLLAQAFKAYGWGRLFTPDERPKPLALAAGNGGAALIGVVLPGRFDDAMRVAVVRRYPGCPAGVRALCLSLVMLGLIDSVALAPLAFVGAAFPGAGFGGRRHAGRRRRREPHRLWCRGFPGARRRRLRRCPRGPLRGRDLPLRRCLAYRPVAGADSRRHLTGQASDPPSAVRTSLPEA